MICNFDFGQFGNGTLPKPFFLVSRLCFFMLIYPSIFDALLQASNTYPAGVPFCEVGVEGGGVLGREC